MEICAQESNFINIIAEELTNLMKLSLFRHHGISLGDEDLTNSPDTKKIIMEHDGHQVIKMKYRD